MKVFSVTNRHEELQTVTFQIPGGMFSIQLVKERPVKVMGFGAAPSPAEILKATKTFFAILSQ